jgi:hypothetical protein
MWMSRTAKELAAFSPRKPEPQDVSGWSQCWVLNRLVGRLGVCSIRRGLII